MKHLKIVLGIAGGILLLCLLTPLIAFLVLHFFILTPEKLTELVTREVNERTSIRFECRKIELNYLDTWPSLCLNIYDGQASIPATNDSVPDLMQIKFRKTFGSVQLLKLLKEQALCVENIFVDEADLHLELGKPLPPLLKAQKEKKEKQRQISFDINRINLSDARLHFINRRTGIETEAGRLSLSIQGNLAAKQPAFDVETSIHNLHCKGNGMPEQQIAFSIKGHCDATERFHDITLADTRFFINQFPFEVDGSVRNLGRGEIPELDIRFNLLASSLKELLEFVPEEFLPDKSSYRIGGNTALHGEVKGQLQPGSVPDIRLKGFISEGSFHKKEIKQGIDTISLNLEVQYKQEEPDSCFIALHNVRIKGLNSSVLMENRITNLQGVPFIMADLKGKIDFDRIGTEFISPQLATLKGQLTTDLSFAFNLKDLQEGNLNRIWADGSLKAQHIEARSNEYKLDAFVEGMDMNIGYKKNRSDFIAEAEVLSGTADIDSMKIAYAQSVFLNLSKLHLRSNTVLAKESHAVVPVTAHLNCASLQAKLSQGNWASAETLELHAGTKPSATDRGKSEGAIVVKANAFKYLDTRQQQAIVLQQGELVSEARPKEGGIAGKWDLKGMLNFNQAQVYSAYFPLMTHIRQTRLSFQNDQLILNRLQVQAGRSDCILSGMLHANAKPKPCAPKLEGSVQMLASNIDYDELKQAFLYGEALLKDAGAGTPALNLDNMEQILAPRKEYQAKAHPIYIPEGVQLDIQLDIDHMNYSEIDLQQVRGNIFIKNRQAHSQLSTRTNLGKVSLAMLYDSRQEDKVEASFDLDLKDVLVGQMHRVIPTVGTLMPLTKAMDGLVDCRLTAEGLLDDQMMPVLASTQAACSLSGQKLILIDNETFREIARKFKFKNKDRNQIDQLSTNLILRDNQIEVIPFLMEWDRYQAIIGGTHSTDFTYNYHLTLLKSPIPIDFGVNITGKAEELHYKIGKCQYKELYKDGGIRHQQQTEERMEKMRQSIIQKIRL